ncbi:unnamed protein product [Closterium sp. Naga37s-1]|nr:unnamed protein product [Closterium sp. Naga37s-1]
MPAPSQTRALMLRQLKELNALSDSRKRWGSGFGGSPAEVSSEATSRRWTGGPSAASPASQGSPVSFSPAAMACDSVDLLAGRSSKELLRLVGRAFHTPPRDLGAQTLVRAFMQALLCPPLLFIRLSPLPPFPPPPLHRDLGALTLVRALMQALLCPLAPWLSLYLPRVHVIATGALIWGLATLAVGLATSYSQVAWLRGINGIGLALVFPPIQSLVADLASPTNRGMAFGWLQFMTYFGDILGELAHQPSPSSHLSSKQAHSSAPPPSSPLSSPHSSLPLTSPHPPPPSSPSFLSNLLHVLRTPSFLIIVSQGIVGSFAWASLTFLPMWLELVGFSHPSTALLLSSFTASCSFGGLFAGWFGDWMNATWRDSGRVICAQISAGSAVVMSTVLLRVVPQDARPIFAAIVLARLRTDIYALDRAPIFAAIVPARLRTDIYALDRACEMSVAAFAPPTVGFLAQACFGFHPSSPSPTPPAAAPAPSPPASPATPPLAPPAPSAADPGNARALSLGLFWTMALPFALCCVLYGGLYWTYPHDRDKARAEAAEEARKGEQQQYERVRVVS